MNCRWALLCGAAVACLLPAAGSTQAAPVSWNWWTTVSTPLIADPTSSAGIIITGVAGPNSQVPPLYPTSIPTEVTLWNMKAFNTGTLGTKYNISNQPLTVQLFIQDGTTPAAATHEFDWTGQISGYVLNGSVHFTNQYVDGLGNPLANTTQSFTFPGSGNTYAVTPDIFDSPSVSGVLTSASALVDPPGTLDNGGTTNGGTTNGGTTNGGTTNGGTTNGGTTNGGDTGRTNGVPEPSTVLLSCLGLSCLGAASWRKWRARR